MRVDNCVSTSKVEYSYCTGGCGTSSSKPMLMINDNDEPFNSMCKCCTGTPGPTKQVNLECTDQTTRTASITMITKCECDVCVKTGETFPFLVTLTLQGVRVK